MTNLIKKKFMLVCAVMLLDFENINFITVLIM